MEHPASVLSAAAGRLGIQLGGRTAQALFAHLELLGRWNTKLNLVGPGTPEHWMMRHTLDSLTPAAGLPPNGRVLDVGSGAGFPGIPLGLVRPDCQIWLAERRSKRRAFLQNAISSLGVSNMVVVEDAAEAGPVDVALARAVLAPQAWLEMGSQLVGPGGRVGLFLQGAGPRMPSTAQLDLIETISYVLPEEPPRTFCWYRHV